MKDKEAAVAMCIVTTPQSGSYYESIYGERRPILGAPCDRHRYYQTMVTSQPRPEFNINNGRQCPPGVEPHRNPYAIQRPPLAEQNDSEEDGINCSPCCDNENIR
uniref:Uncharacterized protein n=1 Tax=Heterorhabditis bacteriophora TaxID=37862 RepID=A0A1I7WNH0_HETBA